MKYISDSNSFRFLSLYTVIICISLEIFAFVVGGNYLVKLMDDERESNYFSYKTLAFNSLFLV